MVKYEKFKRKLEYIKIIYVLIIIDVRNLVMLRNDTTHKLDNKYQGPYKITLLKLLSGI